MTMTLIETRENLVRARRGAGSLELRAATAGNGPVLFGHFSQFNVWYPVNSAREGRFLERVAPGSFARAFKEQLSQVRVMFEHGQDPTVGQKPLGTINALREDKSGAYYEVQLFDTPYVNDLIPAMRSDQLGASFRFSITEGGDEWNHSPRRSAHNPDLLPERTIRDLDLFEFGPVVWGASPAASSDVRSGTDQYVEHLLTDADFLAQFIKRVGENRSAQIIISLVPEIRNEQRSGDPPVEPVPTEEPADSGPDDTPPTGDPEPSAADGAEPPADDSTESNASQAIPEAPVVDPTKGYRNQIAEALKTFRQTNQRSK